MEVGTCNNYDLCPIRDGFQGSFTPLSSFARESCVKTPMACTKNGLISLISMEHKLGNW